jgi:hypothetical protein
VANSRARVLVIACEDFFNMSDQDITFTQAFVIENILTLPINFSALYLVGMSGRTPTPSPSLG